MDKTIKRTKTTLSLLKATDIPEVSGVYIFWQDKTPVYIGKAINLRNRIKSYFAVNPGPKTQRMLKEANCLSYIRVTSEIEALLLEAKLIRKYLPKYNSAARDDKHPLYILLTKEEFPRVITVRKVLLGKTALAYFGPFPSSYAVRSVLKQLRRVFPYSEHKLGKRPCLLSHIGLCDPCPSYINKLSDGQRKKSLAKEYLRSIAYIKSFLSGNFTKVVKTLQKEMAVNSKNQSYEEAALIRDQIARIEYITQPVNPVEGFLENPNLYQDIRENETKELKKLLSKHIKIKGEIARIECFDVAHLAGSAATASMVTFINGEPSKELYRHFKIRQKKGSDDIMSLAEVARRRIKYLDAWGRPDLIVVDGGKGQVGVFVREFASCGIPIVGLAKRFETLVIPGKEGYLNIRVPKGGVLNLLRRVRDEAHRFARRYHHHLVSKILLSQ